MRQKAEQQLNIGDIKEKSCAYLAKIEQILCSHYSSFFRDVCIVDNYLSQNDRFCRIAFVILEKEFKPFFTVEDFSFFLKHLLPSRELPNCWCFIAPICHSPEEPDLKTFPRIEQGNFVKILPEVCNILKVYGNEILFSIKVDESLKKHSFWTKLSKLHKHKKITWASNTSDQSNMFGNACSPNTLECSFVNLVSNVFTVSVLEINLWKPLITLCTDSENICYLLEDFWCRIEKEPLVKQCIPKRALAQGINQLKKMDVAEISIMQIIQSILAPLFYRDVIKSSNAQQECQFYILHDLSSIADFYQKIEHEFLSSCTLLLPFRKNYDEYRASEHDNQDIKFSDFITNTTYRLLIPDKFENLTNNYADQISARHTSGPCHLVGWSYGGLLAYQVGCELAKRGICVGNLYLIESSFPSDFTQLSAQQRYKILTGLVKFLSHPEMNELPSITPSIFDIPYCLSLEQENSVIKQIVTLFDYIKQFFVNNGHATTEIFKQVDMYCHLLLAHCNWEDKAEKWPFQGNVFFYQSPQQMRQDEFTMPKCDPNTWLSYFSERFGNSFVKSKFQCIALEDEEHFFAMNSDKLIRHLKVSLIHLD